MEKIAYVSLFLGEIGLVKKEILKEKTHEIAFKDNIEIESMKIFSYMPNYIDFKIEENISQIEKVFNIQSFIIEYFQKTYNAKIKIPQVNYYGYTIDNEDNVTHLVSVEVNKRTDSIYMDIEDCIDISISADLNSILLKKEVN